ncbi:helix-turn-helix domain-containing protein [Arsenophonus sp.]|uniref:helix-turn-helix domain-containing protein n=1 Tax=Arsenophonus sp. TaxID=1872640 RepID=UPI00387A5A74
MSSLGEKIRKIREAEGINRKELSEMLNIPYSSLNNYEAGRIQVTENIMIRITNHHLFKKYALWLMTGDIAPESGQIAPALAHYGTDGEQAQKRTRKTSKNSDVRSSHYDQKAG